MHDLLITNAIVVNEGESREADILIKQGRIDAIGSDLASSPAKQVLDAAGKTLIPGMIDDQVHFREPGASHKADMATESRAAVAGGITSFMDMPNTNPLTINHEALEEKFQRASGRAVANHSFYLGASNDNIDAIRSLDPKAACGVKVFMGASTGNMLVDNPDTLEAIFRDAPTLIATHCEDTPIILANEASYRERYGEDVPMHLHPEIRSEEACWKSSSFAVGLAKKHNTRLHVLHLTTAREMALFETGPVEGKRITAEACVHHLFFNQDDYATKGSLIKCNPAVKTRDDQQALVQALLDDRLDVIATDHAPHTWEEKAGTYFNAPSGLPLVQDAVLSVLEKYYDGIFSLEMIVNKTSHAVARCYNVAERGFIREGYWADLALLDFDKTTQRTADNTLYKCGWSPFDGYTFRSSIDTTLVNGEIVYQNGQLTEAVPGRRLDFDR